MKKRILILVIVFFYTTGQGLLAVKLSEKTIRQIEKTARECFKQEQLRFELIPLEAHEPESLAWDFDKNSLYRVFSDSLLLGYLIIDQAMGRYDPFDFLVIYQHDLKILKVEILKYRSAHGGEIASNKWLQNFEGGSGNDQQSFLEIDALSGASFSSNGLKEAVARIDKSMWSLFGRNESELR
ncbi:MAG: FMN-binding protein [Bacteroidota bacterium]|nr:FMN-binding protein [Bacteroidota bacterium]